MLTDQERAFLDAMAKAPIPTDVMGLRKAMEDFIPMMNQNLPEIGAFHEAVELRPGLTADVSVPRAMGRIRWSCICTAADGSAEVRGRIGNWECSSRRRDS